MCINVHHTDLKYLHCVEFGDSVEGGELVLLDGFEAANHFRKEYPEMFEVCSHIPMVLALAHGLAAFPVGGSRSEEFCSSPSQEDSLFFLLLND